MHDKNRLLNHWKQPKSCLLIYDNYATVRGGLVGSRMVEHTNNRRYM